MEMKMKDEVVDLTDVVTGFGRYQKCQYLLALLPILFTAMSNAGFVFAAAATKYRCTVPECETASPSISKPDWWPSTLEDTTCTSPILESTYNGYSVVSNDTYTDCKGKFSNETKACSDWVYESSNSIVAEFDLTCEEWKRTLVGTVHNIGVLISMPLMGYVSDRWGRRVAITISAVGLSLGALKTLTFGAAGYPIYLVLELVEAAVSTATYTSCFVLMLELVGKEKRVISSAVMGIFIASGELLLALVVWLLPYWRHFLLIIYCPGILFLSYIFLLEESARWLSTNGKTEKVIRVVQKIAKCNGLTLTDKELDFVKSGRLFDVNNETVPEKFSFKLLISSRFLMKRLVICSWWWFTSAFVYYGLMINSVALPGDKITNFSLSAIATVPGEISAFLLLDRIGRKWTLLSGFLFCGICCVANGIVPNDSPGLHIALFLIGKMLIALCFNAVYVYTSELVPTSARGSLVGACSMVARIGSVLAPLTPLTKQWWNSLPTALFGVSALVAAVLTVATPETLRRDLPDTVTQARNIA